MRKLQTTAIFLMVLFSSTLTFSSNSEYLSYIRSYDVAQSELKLDGVIPYLADNISIRIKTCKNTFDVLDMAKFRETFTSIQQHAELLAITRDVIKTESCNSNQCTIHSNLSERLVAYQGRYDKTTLSVDRTQIEKNDGELKITSIYAEIECK